jgi:hypothetical protein
MLRRSCSSAQSLLEYTPRNAAEGFVRQSMLCGSTGRKSSYHRCPIMATIHCRETPNLTEVHVRFESDIHKVKNAVDAAYQFHRNFLVWLASDKHGSDGATLQGVIESGPWRAPCADLIGGSRWLNEIVKSWPSAFSKVIRRCAIFNVSLCFVQLPSRLVSSFSLGERFPPSGKETINRLLY